MEFIQLPSYPNDGISNTDSYCIGRKIMPQPERLDPLYKFRDHRFSGQNGGTGWYCNSSNMTSFRLNLYF